MHANQTGKHEADMSVSMHRAETGQYSTLLWLILLMHLMPSAIFDSNNLKMYSR